MHKFHTSITISTIFQLFTPLNTIGGRFIQVLLSQQCSPVMTARWTQDKGTDECMCSCYCTLLNVHKCQAPPTIRSGKFQQSGLRFLLAITEISIQIAEILPIVSTLVISLLVFFCVWLASIGSRNVYESNRMFWGPIPFLVDYLYVLCIEMNFSLVKWNLFFLCNWCFYQND